MKNIRVTLVEDSEIFTYIVRKMLASFPFGEIDFQTFEDGLQALDYFRENKYSPELLPDVLFLDINMPVMTGWELLDALSRDKFEFVNNIPVYILSSSDSITDTQQVKNYPFLNGYLTKPLKKDELFRLIRQVG
ncbi:response regulator [Dyadobacter luteus]|uniref:Response regulator n=1 Tax=Dyadobacter luteus TaxID=2259619 RepID=A0A3D8YHK8_9BACT|nr:response regulator [Dyadobacter luteus]REA64007.1 response regulator [Dyadobacter luteus]